MINRALKDDWKYGKKQWEIKDNCFVDSLTERLLGPNEIPGPGSLGFDPKYDPNDPKDEFKSPSGTEVHFKC